ncbi:glycoside hydrolase family 95-like protein [Flavobacterium sp. ZS1P14]|uniref:glycoside hydrolase family 95-like protein n=1 Tax=Flavobacterium sp. ZS1P14 TaxID=3401729 RepID=UPI003AAC9EEA
MTEMLLQSQEIDVNAGQANNDLYIIDLLPAIPDSWVNGSVKGLRARGGFELDIVWEKKQMKTVSIKSVGGTECKIRYNGKIVDFIFQKDQIRILSPEDFK